MSKWNSAYWIDLIERTGATFIASLITVITADGSGAIAGTTQQWWVLLGLPTVLTLLKGLLANLGGAEASASVVGAVSEGPKASPRHRTVSPSASEPETGP